MPNVNILTHRNSFSMCNVNHLKLLFFSSKTGIRTYSSRKTLNKTSKLITTRPPSLAKIQKISRILYLKLNYFLTLNWNRTKKAFSSTTINIDDSHSYDITLFLIKKLTGRIFHAVFISFLIINLQALFIKLFMGYHGLC